MVKKFENRTIVLDVTALELTHKEEPLSIRFTAKEVDLLVFLVEAKDRVVSREELLVAVWGYRDGSLYTRTVDVHVQKLREKLRRVPSCEDWIQTIWAKGYRFEGELHQEKSL
ncbi:MAG: winged helix-turn-helix transcriptional regulator [Deltaproteobacteria bacterium]|nr:winged helix-turn-helix transcriptional regulator [Deltaproteobacteria bacterium]